MEVSERVGPPALQTHGFQPPYQTKPNTENQQGGAGAPAPPLHLALTPSPGSQGVGAPSPTAEDMEAPQHLAQGLPKANCWLRMACSGPVSACGGQNAGSLPLGSPLGGPSSRRQTPPTPRPRAAPVLACSCCPGLWLSLHPHHPLLYPHLDPLLSQVRKAGILEGAGAAYISCRCLGHGGTPTPHQEDLKEALCSGELPGGSRW